MTSRRVTRGVAWAVLAAGAAAGGALGCFGRDNARPLTADAFVSRRVEGRANPQPIDQPGLVIPDGVTPPAYEGRAAPEVTGISPSVREVAGEPAAGDAAGQAAAGSANPQAAAGRATAGGGGGGTGARAAGGGGTNDGAADGRRATGQAAAAPTRGEGDETPSGAAGRAASATEAAPDPSGQYVIYGTVLAEVNDQPIYAHKILTILDSALRAEAQRYDERSFRQVAADFIGKEIRTQQRDELVFAAAQKSLAERERALAEALAAKWRNDEITKAGGSLELARRRWADEGWDFDERVEHQYRLAMNMVYYQKRVLPLVQVTASDIRRYYDANREREFTLPARARFRVIKIDPRNPELKLAGTADARRLAERVRAEAGEGGPEAFDALARRDNDSLLKASGGVVHEADGGFLPKGTYVAERVEDAVWSLEPGQVTDVIEEGGAFYVARLDERQDATERQFEDVAVQSAIRDKLEALQLRELTEREQNRLIREAVIQEQPGMLQTAVDMAMQRYPAWAAAR